MDWLDDYKKKKDDRDEAENKEEFARRQLINNLETQKNLLKPILTPLLKEIQANLGLFIEYPSGFAQHRRIMEGMYYFYIGESTPDPNAKVPVWVKIEEIYPLVNAVERFIRIPFGGGVLRYAIYDRVHMGTIHLQENNNYDCYVLELTMNKNNQRDVCILSAYETFISSETSGVCPYTEDGKNVKITSGEQKSILFQDNFSQDPLKVMLRDLLSEHFR